MDHIRPEILLAAGALVILGLFGGMLTFHEVPQGNLQLLGVVVGAISGALTVAAGAKVAARTMNKGPKAPTAPPAP